MKRVKPFLILLAALSAPLCFASLDPRLFPIADSYKANIEFWEKIFGEYSTTEGVIHDKDDLSLVYRVIRLADKSVPNASKINKKRFRIASQDITKILLHLANGNTPANRKEREIAALFGQRATPARFRAAARNLRLQSGTSDRFAQGIARSGRYLKDMQEIFKSYNLPQELTYLPHVESSFNISAYSKYGAAGLWQFTRSTGKLFMKIGETVDERRDPILATHAAAKLLQKNYNKLANWPLAITAYNHGLAGMIKAKAKHGSYAAVITDYRSRSFKFASRNFYSEFIAAYQVATNYSKYFGQLKLSTPHDFQTIILPGYLPLKTLQERLGLSRNTIYQQNPALRQPVFSGQKYIPKDYPLRLPASVNIANLDHLLPKVLYHSRQKPSLYHTVRKGETASGIARKHGVSLRDLVLANNLDRKATIYPKQKLRIPVKTKKSETIAVSDSDKEPTPGIHFRSAIPPAKVSRI